MIEKLRNLFWSVSGRFSVRMKIMGIALAGILFLGVVAIIQANVLLNSAMSDKMEEHGVAIAESVSARSADYIFTNNKFALLELVQDTVDNNSDVRYVLIQDSDGTPIVHSFSGGIPKGLLDVNQVEQEQTYNTSKIDTEEGLIKDIAMPIFDGRAGTLRIGMSYTGINETVMELNKTLLAIIALISALGILFSFILAGMLTSPLKRMVTAAREVAVGNYDTKVPVWRSRDEFTQLAEAFNDMTRELEKSNQELKNFSREIVQHNQELAAYNAVLQVAGSSFDLNEIVEKSLNEVLKISNTDSGKIIVKADGNQKEVFGTAVVGSEKKSLTEKDAEELEEILTDIINNKVLIYKDKENKKTMHVPLVSSNKGILGIITLIGVSSEMSSRKHKMLLCLGSQIGIAVENALLWQEVKEKEEMRAHLLQKVISVQEEERKRIARELHDEISQSLTSLLVGLKLIEDSKDFNQAQERISDSREVVTKTLSEINKLALELRPTILDDFGLVAALERHINNITKKFHLEIDLQVIGMDDVKLTSESEITIYRIMQEALTNVLKYAEANNVSVILEKQNNTIVLIVEDDGVGFDLSIIKKKSLEYEHLGLFGMEERATIIGGELSIESAVGEGTTIYFKVPLEKAAE